MKRSRQSKILELIDQYEIETQEELAKRLMEAGFQVTQATISRDIRELALTKISGTDGRPRYAALDRRDVNTASYRSRAYGTRDPAREYSDRYTRVLQDGMVSITQADNLVVIKTVSGMAMAVAAAVDALEIEEIAGSIAGDDTVMCAVKSAKLVPGVIEMLQKAKLSGE